MAPAEFPDLRFESIEKTIGLPLIGRLPVIASLPRDAVFLPASP